MGFALKAHVGKIGQSGGGGTLVDTDAGTQIDTTGANLLVGFGASYAFAAEPTWADTKNTGWSKRTVYSYTSLRLVCYYKWNPTVGTSHGFEYRGTGSYASLCVAAFSGANTASDPYGGSENSLSAAAATSVQTGACTPASANDLLVYAAGFDAAVSALSVNIGAITDSFAYVASQGWGMVMAWDATHSSATNPLFSWTTNAHALSDIATFEAGTSSFQPSWAQRSSLNFGNGTPS